MIDLDTNVLVRYLVDDDPQQADEFSRDHIATVFEELVATEELHFEAADDVVRSACAAYTYRRGGAGFFKPDDIGRS